MWMWKVNISNNQKEKIKNDLHSGAESVTIRLKPEDYDGTDLIAVPKHSLTSYE